MKKKIDLNFLYLFIPLLYLEIVFHFIQFNKIDVFTVLRFILFLLFVSTLISFICTRFKSRTVYFVFGLIFTMWFSIYSFLELIFKNFMGDYYSFGTVSDGVGRISQYAKLFVSNARPSYYLCLLTILIFVLLFIFVKFNTKGPFQIPLIICISSFLLLIPSINLGSGINSILHVYGTFSNKDLLVDKIGIEHFFFRDVTALLYKSPDNIIIIDDQDDIPDDTIVFEQRVFDDSNWQAIINSEENSDLKTIDNYLISKSITPTNGMTGKYKDYNFIYFLVESFDYLAIDKDLTPTLYKMYKEGSSFYNHYTPLYSCATGESEFVSYASLFPYTDVCTPNYVQDSQFYESLGFLFKEAGYKTLAIHNWRDEFYDRKVILPNVGIDTYTDIDDIWVDKTVEHTNGWQSDQMLIEKAIEQIEETDGKFFFDIISSVMHFPYDESSYWGDYYYEQIDAVHPDWSIDYKRYMSKCMNFDSGLKTLLDYLESAGLADNTVICLYADHRPYWLDYDKVMDYTSWLNKREGEYGIYRSPFFFYCASDDSNVNNNYCSTLDHVPTIANLFDLNYDPRLYMGIDAYSSSNTVIFTNGNWLNEKGIYDAAKEEFIPNQGVSVDDNYISKTNNNVQNTIKLSYLIFDTEYFKIRKAICSPKK